MSDQVRTGGISKQALLGIEPLQLITKAVRGEPLTLIELFEFRELLRESRQRQEACFRRMDRWRVLRKMVGKLSAA